jgi:hypothetical protein
MEEEIKFVRQYLPVVSNYVQLGEFIEHHYSHLEGCVKNGLYTSSLTHLHILYMVFVYIHIFRIADKNRESFKNSLVGFPREEKELLKEPDFPLILSVINEKTVFRFFRLNNFSEQLIGEIATPVKTRNECLHANGMIVCDSEDKFELELKSYISKMDKINAGNTNILNSLYEHYALDSLMLDEEYELTTDDIETNILLGAGFSLEELRLMVSGREDRVSKFIAENLIN